MNGITTIKSIDESSLISIPIETIDTVAHEFQHDSLLKSSHTDTTNTLGPITDAENTFLIHSDDSPGYEFQPLTYIKDKINTLTSWFNSILFTYAGIFLVLLLIILIAILFCYSCKTWTTRRDIRLWWANNMLQPRA